MKGVGGCMTKFSRDSGFSDVPCVYSLQVCTNRDK